MNIEFAFQYDWSNIQVNFCNSYQTSLDKKQRFIYHNMEDPSLLTNKNKKTKKIKTKEA